MSTIKPEVRIENASIRTLHSDNGPWKQLVGRAIGHPKLGSGIIYSSEVIDVRDDGNTVETRNTIYKRV